MATPLRPHKSRTDSVRADYFDSEGCAALTRTLSRMSQESTGHAPSSPLRTRARPRGQSIRQAEEGIAESPPASERVQSEGSALGTLVENKAEEDKFDFGDRLRGALNRRNEEGIKDRELGVGFVVCVS
jgi:hypothetical protein